MRIPVRQNRIARLAAAGMWLGLLSCGGEADGTMPTPRAELSLRFTTQPTGALGGTAFTDQPTVEVVDEFGNRYTAAAVTVTASIADNPSGGALHGTIRETTSQGIAAFNDLAIDRAGSGYTIRVSAVDVSPATSQPFDVDVGPVSLEMSILAVTHVSLLPDDQMTVTLHTRDAGENPLAVGGLSVEFSASGDPSQGTLSAVTDHDDGTYSTVYTAVAPGQDVTLSATIEGEPIGSALPSVQMLGFTAVEAGSSWVRSSCGILTTGEMYCWGGNAFGVLGDGSGGPDSSPVPVRVSGTQLWSEVSHGGTHACAIDEAGEAYCWGSGGTGQLGHGSSGNGSMDNRFAPWPVETSFRFQDIAADQQASCAVNQFDAAFCWGLNTFGRLGTGSWDSLPDGSAEQYGAPTPVAGGIAFESIAVGRFHACGIDTGGAAHCWGAESWIGNGGDPVPDTCTGQPCTTSPVTVAGGLTFVPTSLTARWRHTCALLDDGSAYCWGSNGPGAIGNGETGTSITTPAAVLGAFQFKMLSAGVEFTCGVITDNDAYCWGENANGQLGTGNMDSATTPQLVNGGLEFASVSAGFLHSCGVTTKGLVYCWGNNEEGQLGDRTTNQSLNPVKVRLFQ